ncbi:ribonuclease J [Facklamia sp. 7083-14-GEN3]|uniref:ribonuclease J n=1 Tax=Facklamia sp. 7083-14-GEN3 TaxID=2973478 RepID=UPI00215C8D2A|nr:ribonuclease J [Facklamia sp. 7083-14-GEN3]MCR8969022.1 ribonuclease J [Facklamia sp. 7083-14-GEN3]
MSEIKVIPLGGIREEGKSMYLVEVDQAIFVLDCGLLYPQDDLLGIDMVIPDFTYLEENAERVVGIFLSHGHADAVGALPYLLDKIDAPVFGTQLTIELASLSARRQGHDDRIENFHVIDSETEIEFGDVNVSFFRTTHTIPDSVGIVIDTKEGAIVFTGDFRFDPSASQAYRTDFGRLTDLGKKKVLALLSDSAEAESPVENVNDRVITEEITEVFRNARGRVIVGTIGSNIMRIQQVLEAAHQSGRTIFFPTKDLYEIVDVALKLDKISIPSRDIFGDFKNIKKYQDEQIVILATGDVGEPIQTIQAMAQGKHKTVTLKEHDTVYIATTPSVSMEKTVARTKDMIYRAGARVMSVTDHFKTSGHATPNDLKLMLNFIQPDFLIPVSGEYRMLRAHGDLALQVGMSEDQIIIPSIGDVLSFENGKVIQAGQVTAGDVLVDGIGVGDIGNVVLRDRRILSEDGIFIVVATISRRLKKILVGPQITSRGFVFMKTSIDLIEACSDITLDVLEKHIVSDDFDWNNLKGDLREKIGKYLYKETKRRPVILPIIMEASNYQVKKGDK